MWILSAWVPLGTPLPNYTVKGRIRQPWPEKCVVIRCTEASGWRVWVTPQTEAGRGDRGGSEEFEMDLCHPKLWVLPLTFLFKVSDQTGRFLEPQRCFFPTAD